MNARAYAVVAVTLAIAACAPDRQPANHEVVVRDMRFSPETLTVAIGDTVTWRNLDIVPHTATAEGAWDSNAIESGAVFQMVVSSTGATDYMCAYHPMMRGRIVVE